MKMKNDFTVIEIGGDYMVVPIGENAASFGGTVVLNEVAAFILRQMSTSITKEELLGKMLNEYEIDSETLRNDLKETLKTFQEIGLIEEEVL